MHQMINRVLRNYFDKVLNIKIYLSRMIPENIQKIN